MTKFTPPTAYYSDRSLFNSSSASSAPLWFDSYAHWQITKHQI
ncbi:hypothetical protein [Dendronalium sp. ChiSLP03b]|nr:hypothetical protein [Dendronalium sp. ChiSLP03b]